MSSPRALTIGSFVAVNRVGSDFRHVPHLTGWDDPPAVRTLMEDRSLGDGSWGGGLSTIDKRVVSIDGFVAQPTHAAAVAVREQLVALNPRTVYALTVDDGVYQRVANVNVTQGAVTSWLNDAEFTYSIQLTAPDPFRRATTSTVVNIAAGATAAFTHVGSFAAEMEVRTTSTGTVTLKSYGAIFGTGATSVASGSIFTSGLGFTNPPRTAIGSTGLNIYNSLIPTNHWLAVLAGANSIQNTGSASVQITYYPTWL